MDAAAKPGRPLDDATKDLKINTLALNSSSANMSGHKDASASDAISCISSVDATITIEDGEMDQEAMMGEQGMCYHAYYYPGFNGLLGEWESQSYVMGTDGSGVQHHAIKADDGSVVYYYPGYHSGYTPYGPFLPGAMIGVEGQYLTHQSYYPSPISPQPLVSSGLFPQPIFYGPELVPAYPWYPSHFYHNGHQESIFSMDSTNSYSKSNYPKRHTLNRSKPLPTSSAASELEGSAAASVKSQAPAIEKQPCKPVNKEAAAAALSEAYLSVDKLPSLSNQGKDKMLYSNSPINMKENGRCWTGDEKLEARNKLNVTGNFDVLSEQNHGPRTNGTFWPGVNPIESPSAKKDHGSSVSTATIDENEYDHPDFLTKYEHALFFVIKSYSEDDIHKSIKYNVWASTPNGNKRLDNAFKLAEEKMAEKNTKCPVFLFFSVNASGQFCGVAEMMGRVDFGKNMDFWQQDKWNGFFPVKWHIIKDIPNPQFRHIILENNDNKPVTNSRDTQEVKFPQGTEMLNIFSSYFSKTSILDDFIFYENRQKAMESKRNHQPALNLMHPLSRNNDLPHASGLGDSKFIVSAPETMKLSAAQTEEELQTRVAAKE